VIIGAVAGAVVLVVGVGVFICCLVTKPGAPPLPSNSTVSPPQANSDAQNTMPPAAAAAAAVYYNPRHVRTASMMRLDTPANFQLPPNAVLVMGPMCRPPRPTFRA
jgi:hypothetical protein